MSDLNLLNKLSIATVGAVFLTLGTVAVSQEAEAFVLFSDRTIFENQLDNFIIDDYSNPSYFVGDIFNGSTLDIHSNVNMSSIVGETEYTTTGFSNLNLIVNQSIGNSAYCAGCNGSFLLDFTSTSIGGPLGVFGVGFDTPTNNNDGSYIAFVTFGDGDTDNLSVPSAGAFFGITSDKNITSIHFGEVDGASTQDGSFSIDNLTIGSSKSIPEPALTLGLFILSALGFVFNLKSRNLKEHQF